MGHADMGCEGVESFPSNCADKYSSDWTAGFDTQLAVNGSDGGGGRGGGKEH